MLRNLRAAMPAQSVILRLLDTQQLQLNCVRTMVHFEDRTGLDTTAASMLYMSHKYQPMLIILEGEVGLQSNMSCSGMD